MISYGALFPLILLCIATGMYIGKYRKPKPDPNAPVKSIPKPKADTTKH